jgi:hypothetical protein
MEETQPKIKAVQGIYQKLLEVQKEIAPIKKTEKNPFFGSLYFDVNGILAALKPILNKQGLVLTQGISIVDGKNVLATAVIDPDDEKHVMHSSILLPENLDPQKMGSAITYYRRYALQSLFALEAADDDANIASQPTRPTQGKIDPKSGGIIIDKTPTQPIRRQAETPVIKYEGIE